MKLTSRSTLGVIVWVSAAAATAHAQAEPAPVNQPAPPPLPEDQLPIQDEGEVIDIVDVSARAAAVNKLRRSAAAVTVVDTEQAQQRAADLGEVLARTEGIGVRRSGGLGSDTRFSLQGLTDDQIRIFFDGIPLELAGFPFGIANVPVNLIERVEVYSGVVPVRFGADALGGAVNLVPSGRAGDNGVSISHELGSFETQRLSAGVRATYDPLRLYTRSSAFLDSTDSSYPVRVKVANELGQEQDVTVRRFHDGYLSYGGSVEVGALPRSWADLLSVRAYATRYDKELQHNVTMTVPYGDASYRETAAGLLASYAYALRPDLKLEASAGGSLSRGRFLDVGSCVYDWYGRCIRQRVIAGETDRLAHDQIYWELATFARAHAEWKPIANHALRLSLAPSYIWRTGDERRQDPASPRDLLEGERALTTFVAGAEHELDALEDKLENVAFAKTYVQHLRQSSPALDGGRDVVTNQHTRFGLGDSLRYRLTPWLQAKASYEWATRLPRPDEVFGDGVFIEGNPGLAPEKSHNANLSLQLEPEPRADAADCFSARASLTGFLRQVDDLIVPGIGERTQSYQNVATARSIGVEASGSLVVPGEWLFLDASVTYLDLRNVSGSGTFGTFEGDRIPNRPYFFASGGARFVKQGLATSEDSLSLSWDTRYVHEFYRGWESIGRGGAKQTIDRQIVHGLGAVYATKHQRYRLTVAFELQNVTDAATYDFFGVQRPGRAYFVKTTAEL